MNIAVLVSYIQLTFEPLVQSIADLLRHLNINPADNVHDIGKRIDIHYRIIIYIQLEIVIYRFDKKFRPAEGVRSVNTVVAVAGYSHIGIAHEGCEDNGAVVRVNGQQHYGVRPAVAAFVQIGADKQYVGYRIEVVITGIIGVIYKNVIDILVGAVYDIGVGIGAGSVLVVGGNRTRPSSRRTARADLARSRFFGIAYAVRLLHPGLRSAADIRFLRGRIGNGDLRSRDILNNLLVQAVIVVAVVLYIHKPDIIIERQVVRDKTDYQQYRNYDCRGQQYADQPVSFSFFGSPFQHLLFSVSLRRLPASAPSS